MGDSELREMLSYTWRDTWRDTWKKRKKKTSLKEVMGAEQDFCCEAVRKRHSTKAAKKEEIQNEIQQKKIGERKEKKIQETEVTFYQFWCECIDWEMIKLFYALLMLFFCMVGLSCFLYLLFVFNFNENLWYFYFPAGKKYRDRFWPEKDLERLFYKMWGLGLQTNVTHHDPLQATLPHVSVELVKSHIPLVYVLACLLAFIVFCLAYFIIFYWVAKGNLDLPRFFQDLEFELTRNHCLERTRG